jgi:hypothetical protein
MVTILSDLPSLRLFGWLSAFAMLATLAAGAVNPAAHGHVLEQACTPDLW